jgi:predicted transglutaminase-like cysteine proteinase
VRPPAPDVFGAVALPANSKSPPPEWDNLRSASLEDASGPWTAMLAGMTGPPDQNTLAVVNRWVNGQVRYVDDVGGDQWSAAITTLTQKTGDCEDFAIAKMALLEKLGVSDDDMFLIIVRERMRAIDHAVLAVRRNGKMYILDNRTDRLLTDDLVTDYLPTLSYSGPFTWIYGTRLDSGR